MPDLNKRSLEAVFQISRCFGGHAGLHETLNELLAVLDRVMAYRHGAVTLLDPRSGDLLVEAIHGVHPDYWKEVRYRKGEGITGVILESGNPLAIPILKNDPRFLNRLAVYDPEAAFLGVPITANSAVRGVFTFSVDARERYRLDDHLKMAGLFANLIGGVLSRLFSAEREKEVILREKDALRQRLLHRFQPDNMVGISKVMQGVFENVQQVARWNTTVLIRGESGTGKELVAIAIHYQSARNGGPFVKLSCAALPETLLETELFGHEKGAFTGAESSKPGRFELAHNGTLFLDEIGDASAGLQAKLLRVLQEGQFERVGGTRTIKVNVRLITATNVDLEKAVAEKRFREDFYYRLNVMPIYLPPLRERKEDIPHLAEYFLEQLGKEHGTRLALSPEGLAILRECDWPGNVRELENCIHRAAVTCKEHLIRAEDIHCTRAQCLNRLIHAAPKPAGAQTTPEQIQSIGNEREKVIAALNRCGGVQAKAARLLNMTPRQIGYRIRKLGIEVEQY